MSSGALSTATPHFTPNHLQNNTPSSVHSALNKPPNEHWALQLQLAQHARELTMAHSYARNSPGVSKNVTVGSITGLTKEGEKEERNRAVGSDVMENGRNMQPWTALDMSGQYLKILSRSLFSDAFTFTTKLYLNNNKLTNIPPLIGRLRNLVFLDLSLNQLTFLPPEMGMLVNLRDLLLFDNRLESLPFELGSLYQLGMLGIEGNPLQEDLKSIVIEYGTTELIKYLREQAQGTSAFHTFPWDIS